MSFTVEHAAWLKQNFEPITLESTKIIFNDNVVKADYGTIYSELINGYQVMQNIICIQYKKDFTPSTPARGTDFMTSFYYKKSTDNDYISYPPAIGKTSEIYPDRHIALMYLETKMMGGSGSMITINNKAPWFTSTLSNIGMVSLNPQDYIYGDRFPMNVCAPFCFNFLAKLGLPKYEDDYSTPQGGNGTYSDTSENIIIENIDTINDKSVLKTSFVSQYWLSQSQLLALSNEFWSDSMTTAIKKMFADPMDAILSLTMLPVVPDIQESVQLTIGRYKTNINGVPLVFKQFVDVDCGSLDIEEYWGNALDYSPNTIVEIFLPYIGMNTISIDDIQASTIKLKYRIDTLTGQCVAFLSRTKDDVTNILYTWSGNCAYNIPLSGANFSNFTQTLIGAIGSVGVGLATGGMGTAVAVGAISSMTANIKPDIARGGAMNGTNGIMGYKTPYIIITRPVQSFPQELPSFKGYQSNITYKLGDLEGFTKVASIHLENINATDKELEEIERLLKEGVII